MLVQALPNCRIGDHHDIRPDIGSGTVHFPGAGQIRNVGADKTFDHRQSRERDGNR